MKINVERYLGAVTRSVASLERDGQPALAVTLSRPYETTVEDLWDAVTNAERIPRWFLPVRGEFRVGGRYQLEGNAGGEILACEAPTRLSVTWEYGGDMSWVDVRISKEAEGGARLTLEHVAYPSAHWDDFGPGAAGVGWDLGLIGLGAHLETGAAVDPKEAEAWSMSPEGKVFIRASSDDWGRASIAAGTDEAAATAAAQRTTDFYTGETSTAS
jgi:uncharacterized protein YndB with AHSA1/START domain